MSEKIPFQKMFDVEPAQAPRPEPLPKSDTNYAPPGGAASGKRKPLPRGEPFSDPDSLVKWSPR